MYFQSDSWKVLCDTLFCSVAAIKLHCSEDPFLSLGAQGPLHPPPSSPQLLQLEPTVRCRLNAYCQFLQHTRHIAPSTVIVGSLLGFPPDPVLCSRNAAAFLASPAYNSIAEAVLSRHIREHVAAKGSESKRKLREGDEHHAERLLTTFRSALEWLVVEGRRHNEHQDLIVDQHDSNSDEESITLRLMAELFDLGSENDVLAVARYRVEFHLELFRAVCNFVMRYYFQVAATIDSEMRHGELEPSRSEVRVADVTAQRARKVFTAVLPMPRGPLASSCGEEAIAQLSPSSACSPMAMMSSELLDDETLLQMKSWVTRALAPPTWRVPFCSSNDFTSTPVDDKEPSAPPSHHRKGGVAPQPAAASSRRGAIDEACWNLVHRGTSDLVPLMLNLFGFESNAEMAIDRYAADMCQAAACFQTTIGEFEGLWNELQGAWAQSIWRSLEEKSSAVDVLLCEEVMTSVTCADAIKLQMVCAASLLSGGEDRAGAARQQPLAFCVTGFVTAMKSVMGSVLTCPSLSRFTEGSPFNVMLAPSLEGGEPQRIVKPPRGVGASLDRLLEADGCLAPSLSTTTTATTTTLCGDVVKLSPILRTTCAVESIISHAQAASGMVFKEEQKMESMISILSVNGLCELRRAEGMILPIPTTTQSTDAQGSAQRNRLLIFSSALVLTAVNIANAHQCLSSNASALLDEDWRLVDLYCLYVDLSVAILAAKEAHIVGPNSRRAQCGFAEIRGCFASEEDWMAVVEGLRPTARYTMTRLRQANFSSPSREGTFTLFMKDVALYHAYVLTNGPAACFPLASFQPTERSLHRGMIVEDESSAPHVVMVGKNKHDVLHSVLIESYRCSSGSVAPQSSALRVYRQKGAMFLTEPSLMGPYRCIDSGLADHTAVCRGHGVAGRQQRRSRLEVETIRQLGDIMEEWDDFASTAPNKGSDDDDDDAAAFG